MRKRATIILLAVSAAAAYGQTMNDALQFSEYNYGGTARTMAMGNAFTALGGDLGAVTINPAGNAVARYSQFTITPSLNVSVNNAVGLPFDGAANGFERQYRNAKSTAGLPNIGFAVNYDTHRTSGIKNVSFGFIANVTNTYRDAAYARGTNPNLSFAGAMSMGANGLNIDDLLASNAWDNYNLPFYAILGAQSGIFELISDEIRNDFIGINENLETDENGDYVINNGKYNILSLPVDQTYNRRIAGNKYDYVFNLSANISDIIFIGANLGISSINYRFEETILEQTDKSELFQSGFRNLKYSSAYSTSGTGVYGKFGIIATPVAGLRLGAAIQTPTAMVLRDSYYMKASTEFADPSRDAASKTPEGEYEYRLEAPFRFNVGAAYTFGTFGLVSVDYEMCDYSAMRFRGANSTEDSNFDGVNAEITDFMSRSHMLRAGIEFKPVRYLAIRGGYGFTTSPEISYDDAGNIQKSDNMSHRFSFGLGLDSGGSFFADLACSSRKNTDYIYPYSGITPFYDDITIISPEIENKRNLWTVALTLGFRF